MASSYVEGDLFQITQRGHCLGQAVDNVWYLQAGPAQNFAAYVTNHAALNEMAVDFWDAYMLVLPQISSLYTLYRIDARHVSGVREQQLKVPPPYTPKSVMQFTTDDSSFYEGQEAGQLLEEINDTGNAVSCILRTAGSPRKRFQGYKRIGTIPEESILDNIVVQPYLNDLQLVLDAFLLAWQTSAGAHNYNGFPSVASAAALFDITPPFAWPIQKIQALQIVGNQRSRDPKRRFA